MSSRCAVRPICCRRGQRSPGRRPTRGRGDDDASTARRLRQLSRWRRDEGKVEPMGKVVAQAIMSLDGYVAKQDNTIGRLFDWLQNGEVELPTPAGDFEVHLT